MCCQQIIVLFFTVTYLPKQGIVEDFEFPQLISEKNITQAGSKATPFFSSRVTWENARLENEEKGKETLLWQIWRTNAQAEE